MRTKQPEFLEILSTFVGEYMPFTAGLSNNTVRLYKATFRLLLTFMFEANGVSAEKLTFQMLDYATILAFLNWLETERNCSAATRNVRLAALSSFADYAQNRNADAAIVFLTAVRKIPAKKTSSNPRVFFTREEIAVLLRLPDTSTAIGKRDAVLLALMYASGTRAQEVCDLRVRDVLFDKDNVILTITGKGDKTRRIRIARFSSKMLRNYLIWLGIDRQLDKHIFSTRTHEHMTISCVEAIYKKYLYTAKQQNPSMFRQSKYSPHSMRHTTAMHMLEAGVPMMAIKNFLGHASVTTTERYVELSQSTVDKHIKAWNQRWFPDTTATKEDMRPTAQTGGIPDFLR